jgi:hypothetical protein
MVMVNNKHTDNLTAFSANQAREMVCLGINGGLSSIKKYCLFPGPNVGIIEIAGMPLSYKSTLTLYNTYHFRKNGRKCDYVKERESIVNKRLYPIHHSISLAAKTIESLLKMNKEEVYLLDRGAYDQIAFLHTYHKLGYLDEKTFNLGCDYLVKFYTDKVAGLVICQSEPQDSLRREGERLRPGFVMNTEFLNELKDSYINLPKFITDTRLRVGLGKNPLPIISLDSSIKWKEYKSLFLKSTRTLLQLNLYGITN